MTGDTTLTLGHLVKVLVWAAGLCATYHGGNISLKLCNSNVEMDQINVCIGCNYHIIPRMHGRHSA